MCSRVRLEMEAPGEKARDTADWETPAASATSYDVIDFLDIRTPEIRRKNGVRSRRSRFAWKAVEVHCHAYRGRKGVYLPLDWVLNS